MSQFGLDPLESGSLHPRVTHTFPLTYGGCMRIATSSCTISDNVLSRIRCTRAQEPTGHLLNKLHDSCQSFLDSRMICGISKNSIIVKMQVNCTKQYKDSITLNLRS